MKMRTFVIDGQPINFISKRIGQILWVHTRGQTWTLDLTPKAKRKSGSSSKSKSEGNEVLSPMPGKILRVLTEVGAIVKKEQTLIIMEAMKMEYSLSAPCDGKILKLKCQEGKQVDLGQSIVEIEPPVGGGLK